MSKDNSLEASTNQKVITFTLALLSLYLAGHYFSPNNLPFFRVTPHPYLVTSIVLSCFYGFTFAINFSLAAGAMYLGLLHMQTDYKSVETLISLEYLSLPVLNLMFCGFLGELKTRSLQRIRQLERETGNLNTSTDALVQKVKTLTTESFDLKKRLVNKLETFKSVLELTKGFHNLERDDLIDFYFKTVTSEIGAKDAVYYEYDQEKEMYFIKEFLSADNHPMVLNAKTMSDPLLNLAFKENRIVGIRELYRSTSTFPEEANQALLCVPVIVHENVVGYFAVYDLPFLEYTPNNFGLVEVLTGWLEKSILYSDKFHRLSVNSIYNASLEVYTYQYFKEKLVEDFEAVKRYGVDHYLLRLSIVNAPKSNITTKSNLRKLLAQIIKANLRKTDILCEGRDDSYFNILVPFLKGDEVNSLSKKLDKEIEKHRQGDKMLDLLQVDISIVNLADFDSVPTLETSL